MVRWWRWGLPLLMLLAGCRTAPAPAPAQAAAPAPVVAHRGADDGVQPNAFYDARLFEPGLRAAKAVATDRAPARDGALLGGVVPHHILAAELLSTFFLQLEAHPPATVILVGPNHEERGQRVITGLRGWATDFGTVAADEPLVEQLVKSGLATLDDEALSTEHAVGALMPYLKYHAPVARVVPIILHKDVTPAEVRRLAEVLEPLLGPDRVLLGSVDFSHYLTRPEAEAKDKETLATLQAFDLQTLWRMGPDHLDSPPSIGLVMTAMQMLKAKGPEMLGHTNSGIILGSDRIETTSYFLFAYRH
jgi:MEMO1 family protein